MRPIGLGKMVVAALCVTWMSWALWTQFIALPAGDIENHSSQAVKDRMSECSGTYQERYDCKNAIVIETDRDTFFTMLGRIVIVVVPPLLLIAGIRALARPGDESGAGGEVLSHDSTLPYQRRHYRRRGGRRDASARKDGR